MITARDLLRLPAASATPWHRSRVAGGTVLRLPDGSTATVISVNDESWRGWNMDVVIVYVIMEGPAATATLREVLTLTGACGPVSYGLNRGEFSIGLPGKTLLALVAARSHSCGADPGTPCRLPGYQGPCRAGDAERHPVAASGAAG